MAHGPVLFLSHSGADTETARELKRRLLGSPDAQASGLEIWFDKDDLLPGQGWQEQLEQAINRSTAFAVVVGTKGVVNWVDREVRLGLSRATDEGVKYPFVPVLITPDVSKLPPFARLYQGVHLHTSDDAELGKLLQSVLGIGTDQEGAAGRRQPVRLTGSPFIGLRAMTEAEGDRFFGREAEVEELVETVKAHRLVVIVADSGSGKSSLAQAGLIPRIRGGALENGSYEEPDERVWQVVIMRPGADPVENLRVGITAAAERLGLDGEKCAALRRRIDPANRDEWVYALQCDLPVKTTETLLIVDQFEELLTQTPADKRQPFIDWLMAITRPSAANAVRVVLTIRSDYFNLCSSHEAFYERIKSDAPTPDAGPAAGVRRSAHVRLKALTVAFERNGIVRETSPKSYSGLAAIVHRPLILAGHTDEAEREALLVAIRRDVSDRPGDLALVQVALYETWRESHAGRDNLIEAFSRIGGVAGALANAAETVRTEKLNDRERALLEAVLVRLVTLGDTGGATRRLGRREEFDAERAALAEKLTTDNCRRLLLAGTDSFEICHEQLITQWPWWQNCLSAAAGDMRRLARLMLKSAEWCDGGKARRHLATGAELDLFSGVAARRRSWLSKMEVAFVTASTFWARVWRGAGMAAVVALVVTTGATIVANNRASNARDAAVYQQHEADKQRQQAEAQRKDADQQRVIADQQKQQAETNETLANAQRNQVLVTQSRFFADLARQRREAGDSATALALAIEALSDRPYVPEAEFALDGAWRNLRERIFLEGHAATVNSAAFSPDGQRIVTASADNTARLWDAGTGKPIGQPLSGHTNQVYSAAFSPDGQRIVTASADKTARLWDADTGKPIGQPLSGHMDQVMGAAFSPDGRRIVTASLDQTARLWDADTGKPIGQPLSGHRDRLFSAAFSPDGQRIVTASYDNTARLWDADTGKPIGQPLSGHTRPVDSAVFSPDGQRIVTVSWDKTARLWDTKTGKPIGQPLSGHRDQVVSAAFSPDGRRIVTASYDNTAWLWDADTGKPIGQPLSGHRDRVLSATFNPDGRRIVTTSADHTAQLWDADTGKPIGQPLSGHTDQVVSAVFSPDGQRIVTASADHTARLWDADTGKPIGQPLSGGTSTAGSKAFSPDSRRIVTSADHTARLWDADTGKPIGQPLSGHTDQVYSAAFSPDGRRIVTASADHTARLWDADTGKPIGQPLSGHRDRVWSAAFSPDGRRIVTTVLGGTARLWDADTGKPIGQPLSGQVYSAAFSPDGRRIVTASADHTARLWDGLTGKPIGQPLSGHTDQVMGAAFSPDGRRIVTASLDQTARLWDADTGKPIGQPLSGHTSLLLSAAFSPDGQRIVTASEDKTARLWDADTGKPIGQPLSGHVYSAAFSPDGRRIVTASGDGAQLWDTDTGTPVGAPLSGHKNAVVSAVFSPDGRRIVTASEDKTARLWDTGKPIGQPLRLSGDKNAVASAAFSPDSRRIVTASADNMARLWGTARLWEIFATTQKLVAQAKAEAPRCLTPAQRKEFFLAPEPPAWCIEEEKWPYHTPMWKTWLADTRAGRKPSLPTE